MKDTERQLSAGEGAASPPPPGLAAPAPAPGELFPPTAPRPFCKELYTVGVKWFEHGQLWRRCL